MTEFTDRFYPFLVSVHVAAGTLALLSFWIAGFARKGGRLHVRSGDLYLWAMRGILVSGLPMALASFAKGKPIAGTFLLYLVVLVATTVFIAPRAVRLKKDFDAFRSGNYRWFAVGLPLTALIAFGVGISQSAPVLWGFSLVGLHVGMDMFRNISRAAPQPGWWLREHYGAMIGNGIGTHIAFLSIGLSRLIPADLGGLIQSLSWFGPLAIGLSIRLILDRNHRRKFGSRPVAVVGQAASA